MSVKPEKARPSKRIRFKGAGFTDSKPVYAHYVYKNKVRKTVRMARKTGHLRDVAQAVRARSRSRTRGPASGPSSSTSRRSTTRRARRSSTGVYVQLQIRVALVRNPG